MPTATVNKKKVCYINIQTEIISSEKVLSQIQDQSIQDIMMNINSPGGSVFAGFAIYNALKLHPAKVHATVSGVCASIASVILMAADTIEMTKNSSLMIHLPTLSTFGNAEDLRREADMLDRMQINITDAYKTKMKIPADLDKMLKDETWLSPEDAKKLGFCDIITDTTPKFENFFDFQKYQYVSIPDSVLNLYDISAKDKTPEVETKESEMVKIINKLKGIFQSKETSMSIQNEATEEKVIVKDEIDATEETAKDEETVVVPVPEKEKLLEQIVALKAEIETLKKESAAKAETVVEEEQMNFVNALVAEGKIRPIDVDIHVDSLVSRAKDTLKLKAYRSMLEALPANLETGKHFANKDDASDKTGDSLNKDATKLFAEYKAKGVKNVTLGDCIKEIHNRA